MRAELDKRNVARILSYDYSSRFILQDYRLARLNFFVWILENLEALHLALAREHRYSLNAFEIRTFLLYVFVGCISISALLPVFGICTGGGKARMLNSITNSKSPREFLASMFSVKPFPLHICRIVNFTYCYIC